MVVAGHRRLRGPARFGRWRRHAVWAAMLAMVALAVTACSMAGASGDPSLPHKPYSAKPNIVYVLTDDLDSGLVKFMPHVLALEQQGMTFTNFSVTDSLCCPSRASIFTGDFPHNTHVIDNTPPEGGFGAFYAHGDENRTFATALQAAGYRTAMMGKYLNAYAVGYNPYNFPTDHVPPGWDQWDVTDNGYVEFNYDLNENHRLVHYGGAPSDYLTDVISGTGRQFIRDSASARKPFFLELATFSPHWPYVAAPQDRGKFQGLRAPRGPSFGVKPFNAPRWLADQPPLHHKAIAKLDRIYVKRVEDVQSVDRMIGAVERTLRQTGQLSNTVFIFNSDNGLHLGQHGLKAGKLTAFETDIHVPLVVAGPGIPAGSTNPDVVENIDLAPTFEALAGARVSPTQDGRSLVPLLHGAHPTWRTVALVEHWGPDLSSSDPDAQSYEAGNPPTYKAIRTSKWTYVRYVTGAREFYNRVTDPYEMDNLAGSLSPARLAQLNKMTDALAHCSGMSSCWRAGRPGAPVPTP
ncbi:MAG TPA: sulfatase [Jatrophihabitans sp.]|nr:sulfatase [Jatrophihabitans sp.]